MINWIKDNCEEYEKIYKFIGILGLLVTLSYTIAGFFAGPSNTMIYEYAEISKFSIIIAYIFEIVEAICWIVPIFMAFIHDLFFEKQPKHLIITLLLELFIFAMLKFFRILGGNLLFFLGIGIMLCFVIGGSSVGMVLLFDWAVTGGVVFIAPIVGFIGPLLLLGILVSSISEFFSI